MIGNLFITFEGPEGAGKTSVLKVISERLQARKYRCISNT